MSNRIDFFQPAETSPALPAATVSVMLDGILCPYLEPVAIERDGWNEFSRARLAYNPAAYQPAAPRAVEQIEALFGMGKSVRIEQVYNGTPPGAAAFGFPIFVGHIEGIETRLSQDNEQVEIIAEDFAAVLKRITVYGQRLACEQGTGMFLSGLDTCFNPDGRPNASCEAVTVDGKSYTAFCAEPSQSRFWSCAEVIDYLLCEYLPGGCLQRPETQRLRSLTDDEIVRDLDVTGLNMAEALHRCCEQVGLAFKFVPRLSEVGPGQAIVFYKGDTGRKVELNCRPVGERLSISKTNIARLSSTKDFQPVTHKYIGQGDFKVYEATFELVKAWDPADEGSDYDEFSASTNPQFYQVKDVYRKWCLNEAGDYTAEPYNQGGAFDFSKVFETKSFARRRRRFWPCLSADKQGKSLGYYLEVSFDDGEHWWQYLHAFNNLLDECGVWLSSDRLDTDTWVAALKGVLKFRITASVVGDERLMCSVADGPVGSTVPTVEKVSVLARRFKFRRVSPRSIFAAIDDGSMGKADEVDDTAALYQFVRRPAASGSAPVETADVQTPCLFFDYQVGDIVTSAPESRDLFGCKGDNRSVSRVERVRMDFRRQCTDLRIVRRRSW